MAIKYNLKGKKQRKRGRGRENELLSTTRVHYYGRLLITNERKDFDKVADAYLCIFINPETLMFLSQNNLSNLQINKTN